MQSRAIVEPRLTNRSIVGTFAVDYRGNALLRLRASKRVQFVKVLRPVLRPRVYVFSGKAVGTALRAYLIPWPVLRNVTESMKSAQPPH